MPGHGTFVLVHLPHEVRLVLRKEGESYRFDSWKRPSASSRDLFLDWKLEELMDRELRNRSFATLEDAKRAFTNELLKLAPRPRSVR
ncbi:MAG: hypothetical protein ACREQQ_14470 [Candidatus Binatia bacterium]